MQHAIERMIRCNIPASVAASPINHERQRGDCAREQIDASPRRSEPKHASRSDRATVLIFGRLVGMELEFRCARGCFGKKTPDDLAILGGVLISARSEGHTSELQSLMRISYAIFCLKKTNKS